MWLIVTQCIYFTIGAMLQEGESSTQIWLISNDLTIFIVLSRLLVRFGATVFRCLERSKNESCMPGVIHADASTGR
jgi:hypothetical protein